MKGHIWIHTMLIVCVAAMGTAQAAIGQDVAEEQDETAEVVIEVDDEGRILVDGEPVSGEGGRVVVRVGRSGRIAIDSPRGGTRVIHVPERRVEAAFRRAPRAFEHFGEFMANFEPPDVSMFEPPHFPIFESPHFPQFESPHIQMFEPFLEGGVQALMEEHREVAGLERESRELASRARRAEGEERRELEAQLREKLDEIFERKMEIRRERVAEVAERIQDQRTEIQERAEARQEIIERRFQHLLGDSDVLDW